MYTVYYAKHILKPSGEILIDGAVAVCDGLVAGVGPRGLVPRSVVDRAVDLGDILLMPGFINLHTHLEESPIRSFRKEPGESFAAWTTKKNSRMRHLSELSPDQIHASVRLNVREMLSQGITTIVDSTRTGVSADVLAREPVRSVIMLEIAGDEFVDEGIARVREWMNSGPAFKYGICPHALYSLRQRSHRKLIEFSYDTGSLWSCHAAESAEELQAFCEQNGDFFFNLTRKKPWPAGNLKLDPLSYAFAENLIPSHAILYHCNYAPTPELALLASKHAFVTLCLKYNEQMEHKSFPIEVARKRGLRICLGTEGIVPPGETNLLDDLFHLKMEYPHISAAEMLRWVTQNPAAALKSNDKLGEIAVGKYADIIGIKFSYNNENDILEEMLMADQEIAFVMVGGEEIIV